MNDNILAERQRTIFNMSITAGVLAAWAAGGLFAASRPSLTHLERGAIALLSFGAGISTNVVIASTVDWLSERNRLMYKMGDQLMAQSIWDTQELPISVMQSPPGVGGVMPKASDSVPIMTWADFKRDYIYNPGLRPHIGVFAQTGFGKTLLCEVIGELRYAFLQRRAKLIYCSPTVDDNEFLGWYTVGNAPKDNFKKEEISRFGELLDKELVSRYNNTPGEFFIVCLDEFRWSTQNTKIASAIKDVLSIGRKQGLNIIMSAVTLAVKTLGFEGEQDLKSNMTIIMKGDLADARVRELVNNGALPPETLEYWNDMYTEAPQRMCLVQDRYIMTLPDLSGWRQAKIDQGTQGYIPFFDIDSVEDEEVEQKNGQPIELPQEPKTKRTGGVRRKTV